jgi:hypothetical protein
MADRGMMGVVYTVQAEWGGPVKIGYCAREEGVAGRVVGIQTGYPWRLVVRRIIPGNRLTESDLHDRLAKYRMVGEWFMNAPPVAMATGAKLPGRYDLERVVQPVLDSAFQAGVHEGRRQHEIKTRNEVSEFFALATDYFGLDEYPPDEEHGAMERALVRLRKLCDKPLMPPDTGPHIGLHIPESDVA